MKKRSLLFVSFTILIASVVIYSQSRNSKNYTPRFSHSLVEGFAEAAELYRALRANPETGEFDTDLYRSIQEKEKAYRAQKGESSLGLAWSEVGPDNFGGRTRALLITQDDVMFAGSTTGGLFKSTNKGNTWEQVSSFDMNYAISCITQLGNGHIYIGTGNSAEVRGYGNTGIGNGLFVSTDNGDTWDWALDGNGDPIKPSTFGGGAYSIIDAIVADPVVDNKLWLGSNEGLQPYVEGTGFLAMPDGLPNSACQSIAISGDGSVIAASVGSDNFYLSTDGGQTFEDRAGNGPNEIPSNVTRLIVAVSPDNPDFIYGAVAVGNPGTFGGVYASSNGGETFELVWPGDVPEVSPDRPNDAAPVAWYALSIAVVPGSPGLIVLGCLDVWIGGVNSQPEQQSLWSFDEFSPGEPALDGSIYCHADICTFEFDSNGDLYIGGDGGVFRTTDGAASFTSMNRFYNVAQQYSIGISGNDKVLGGSQDNGTNYVTKTQSTVTEGVGVNGGDGMGCDVSSLNAEGNVIFTSVPNNIIFRSNDGGTLSMTPMITGAMFNEPSMFESQVRLWEGADQVTPYTVEYVNMTGTDLPAGYELSVNSRIDGYTFSDTLQAALPAGDTLVIMDPATSLFAIGYSGSGGVYVTRNACYFDSFPLWAKVKNFVYGYVTDLEWSNADGNYLWVSSYNASVGSSRIYRISGFNNAWNITDMQFNSPDYVLSIDSISVPNSYVTDIAVDPENEDHVLYTKGGFGGNSKVMESTNATSSNFSFTNVWFANSDPLAGMPVYSCIIEQDNPNTFIVGTEFGVYATDNGGADWSPENAAPLGPVPVYTLRQQTQSPDIVSNAGYIYVGSYGRGAFRSTTYEKSLAPTGGIAGVDQELVEDLKVLPNPMNDIGWLTFNASEKANVEMDIFNLNGQKLRSLTYQINEGENRIQLNVYDLSEGTYIIQLRKDTKVSTNKFVIIR
jgi:hypothetical protein